MEITNYKNFIIECFENISTNYNMKWVITNDYVMKVSNGNILIYFSREV